MFEKVRAVLAALLFSATTLTANVGAASESNSSITTEVTDTAQINKIKQLFQSDLTRLGSSARIIACDHTFDYTTQGVGRDTSYGASCSIDTGTQKLSVLMCDDVMLGKFTLTGSGNSTRSWFTHFIQENCPPGG
jgi:predicted small secreted protein